MEFDILFGCKLSGQLLPVIKVKISLHINFIGYKNELIAILEQWMKLANPLFCFFKRAAILNIINNTSSGGLIVKLPNITQKCLLVVGHVPKMEVSHRILWGLDTPAHYIRHLRTQPLFLTKLCIITFIVALMKHEPCQDTCFSSTSVTHHDYFAMFLLHNMFFCGFLIFFLFFWWILLILIFSIHNL